MFAKTPGAGEAFAASDMFFESTFSSGMASGFASVFTGSAMAGEGDAEASGEGFCKGSVTVTFDVRNTGKRDGDEVAQLYIHEVKPAVVRPAKELRGFQRLSLKTGETRTVSLSLPAEKLAYWDEKSHAFTVHPGAFEILVGASS